VGTRLEDSKELSLFLLGGEIPGIAPDNDKEAGHHPTSDSPVGGCGCGDNDDRNQNEHDRNCDKESAKDVHG